MKYFQYCGIRKSGLVMRNPALGFFGKERRGK